MLSTRQATCLLRTGIHKWRNNCQPVNGRSFGVTSQCHGVAGTVPLDCLTEEERLLEQTVDKFGREEIAPIAAQMDKEAKMPPSLIQKLFDNGLMGIEIPVEYGGAGLDFFSSLLTVKTLAKYDLSTGTLVDAQNLLVINSFRNFGSPFQKEQWFPVLAKQTNGAFALSEAGSGSDAFALATTATQDGDHYVINGSKMWCSYADTAGILLVMANADLKQGYRGITCFIVEKGTPGLTVGEQLQTLGIRAVAVCPLTFTDMKVHKSQVLGEVGGGYKVAMSSLNEGRLAMAAQMIGLSEGCFEHAVRYTKERKQFGQRIYDFQAMQHQISHYAAKLEAARLLVYNTARQFQAGAPITKQAAMSKYLASELAQRISSKSVEWMGGVGFTKDNPVERFYRDCKIGVIGEGTSNIQLNVIAKTLDKEIS